MYLSGALTEVLITVKASNLLSYFPSARCQVLMVKNFTINVFATSLYGPCYEVQLTVLASGLGKHYEDCRGARPVKNDCVNS